MSTALAFVAGLATGLVLAGLAVRALAARRHAALRREAADRIAPPLERRAAALGIELRAAPSVDLGSDGELVLHEADPLHRLCVLAEAIDEREAHDLGYVDTLRVPKNEVDAQLRAAKTTRRTRKS